MNIHSDKSLKIIIASIIFMIAIPTLGLAFISAGIKGLLFGLWIIFILSIYGIIILLTIDSGLSFPSASFRVRAISGYIDYHIYRYFLVIFLIIITVLSGFVWKYLDHAFPKAKDRTIVTSSIPSPLEQP